MQPNTNQLDAIDVPVNELKAAFERTDLNRIGYSFDRAMQCPLIKRRLVRMALNRQYKVATEVEVSSSKVVIVSNPEATHWWKKYY